VSERLAPECRAPTFVGSPMNGDDDESRVGD
jgi:hypothetical protein